METIASTDGTIIAYERTGHGPPLVLVHGTGRDHALWASCLPYLAPHASVYAVDRRGRGASGDAPDYALDREVDDLLTILAVLDQPAVLFGHSYGAIVALEAAMQTDRLRGLILYEPPLSVGPDWVPPDLGEELAAILATEGREAVLVTFMRQAAHYSEEAIATQRAQPDWPARVAASHTLPREVQVVRHYPFAPERVAAIRVPTLLLLGSESPPFLRLAIDALAAALPSSRMQVLSGQHHNAMETAPALLTDAMLQVLHAVPEGPETSAGRPALVSSG